MRPRGYAPLGPPAENAAIKEGRHPREVTERNIAAIRRQMERMGWAIDWGRVLATHEPEYYRWTQWLFLRFYEAGLAYRREAPVKWCPNDQTVLANEQVIDGRCERCGAEVEVRNLEQWFFRITAYADTLLEEMALLESWPERVLTMQRNWIGRSEGAEVVFRIEELDVDLPVFTTRPDTLFGATFFVLAPEHPLVPKLAEGSPHAEEILDYARHAAARSAVDRADPEKEKTGVFTGRFVTNPVNDHRLRDWLLSRQRYWGCPIPILYCDQCGMVPVPDEDLPVLLPEVDEYLPKGRSPLAAAEDWVATTCPTCDGAARRETDTMDTFVDSSWYFIRYCDAQNDGEAFQRAIADYWLPVNQYIGGIEHAILHLLYARFFTKVM